MSATADAIRELELRLMDPAVRRSSLAEALLADDFVEFGSSGRTYTKASVLDAMRCDPLLAPDVVNFAVKDLGTGVILATYETNRRGAEGEIVAKTLRCSVWRIPQDGGKLCFTKARQSQYERAISVPQPCVGADADRHSFNLSALLPRRST